MVRKLEATVAAERANSNKEAPAELAAARMQLHETRKTANELTDAFREDRKKLLRKSKEAGELASHLRAELYMAEDHAKHADAECRISKRRLEEQSQAATVGERAQP